jgi:hypothetical protein
MLMVESKSTAYFGGRGRQTIPCGEELVMKIFVLAIIS